jgi:hypothetical protein
MSRAVAETKHCYRCGEEKSVEKFYRNAAHPDGLSGSCRACDLGYERKRRSETRHLKYKDPDVQRQARRAELADQLGLEESELTHWTEARIIAAIKAWAKRTGKPPTICQWRKPTGVGPYLATGRVASRPNAWTVQKRFGSWNSGIAAAGLEPRLHAVCRWTREEIVLAIQAWAKETGVPPTCRQWSKAGNDTPTAAQVQGLFGSWNEAIAAAGFEPRQRGWIGAMTPAMLARRARSRTGRPNPHTGVTIWTSEKIVAAIQAWTKRTGVPPTAGQWDKTGGDVPNRATVCRRFGSWSAGIKAAGIEPRQQGHRYDRAGRS